MGSISEVIEAPLTDEALAERYRELCADSRFANLPGKVELDTWGRILMSPASNYHGILQARLGQRLAALDGQALMEASVVTAAGVLVADVAWISPVFLTMHRSETPFARAPELCIEIASPSNSLRGLQEKVEAYLACGAVEAWLVYPKSRRIEFYGKEGRQSGSQYPIDLAGLFD